jgi:hypothetical protein
MKEYDILLFRWCGDELRVTAEDKYLEIISLLLSARGYMPLFGSHS